MFCVLNIRQRERTLIERLFGFFRKDEYALKTVPVFKGAPFFELSAVVGKNGVDWDCVVRVVGKCALRLVVSSETDLPESKYVGVFKSDMLYKMMMHNTFEKILKTNSESVSVCVVDEKAKYKDFVLRISNFASQISVVTLNKSDYVNVCDEMQELNGLCPSILSNKVSASVYIDADNCIMKIGEGEKCIEIHSGQDFTVPEIYAKLLPEDVNKYDFYSALYELCGVFSINQCSFDTVIVNNEKRCVGSIHFS